ncbi:putative adhesin [Streptomyces sp. NPDC090029]|uniref:putative adhesin n=1 Tax=Streptomyces sp. NPDC090029 TaxID=3365924 RepID=UPI0037FF03F5
MAAPRLATAAAKNSGRLSKLFTKVVTKIFREEVKPTTVRIPAVPTVESGLSSATRGGLTRGHAPPPTFGKGVSNGDPWVVRWPGGRANRQHVVSGHGTWDVVNGERTTVPRGTWCVFYCADGAKLSDGAGLAVEQGLDVARFETVKPGTEIRDLTIHPPRSTVPGETMVVMKGSVTTSEATSLSSILKPDMGPVHIATCREWC